MRIPADGRPCVAMSLEACEDPVLLDAHLAYHLRRGLRLIVAAGHLEGSGDALAVLNRHAHAGRVLVLSDTRDDGEAAHGERMREVASSELGADWLLPGHPGEFWWPEAGSLAGVLSALPARVRRLEAEVLDFVPGGGATPRVSEMVIRRAAVTGNGGHGVLRSRLRRAVRLNRGGEPEDPSPHETVETTEWRPIAVLRVPQGSSAPFDEHPELGSSEVEAGIRDGHLIVDRRLQRYLSDVVMADDEPQTTAVPGAPVESSGAMESRMEVAEFRADALEAHHARQEERLEKLLGQIEKAERRERKLEARVRALEARSRGRSAGGRALRSLRNRGQS